LTWLVLSYLVLPYRTLPCLCREKELAAVKVDKEDIKVITEELEVSSHQKGPEMKGFRLVLFCRVVSCLVLSCHVASCLALPCLVVSCRVVSCIVMSCRAMSCLSLLNPFLTIFCSQNKGLCGSCRQSAQGGWRGFRASLENTGSLKVRVLV
jgi:hypothetical protein